MSSIERDKRFGCEIYSRFSTKNIDSNTIGLKNNVEFYIVLINNSFNLVHVTVYLDGKYLGEYQVSPQTTEKTINYENENQFFIFNPNKVNRKYSKLHLEWRPIVTKYTYKTNYGNLFKNSELFDYKTQTMLEYDKRINYGCVNSGFPKNTFTDDLNLGISSNKFNLKKEYVSDELINQYIKLVEINPTYELVNVKNYLKNIDVPMDVPKYQLLDKIL